MTKLNIEKIPFRYTQECLLTLDEQLEQMYESYHSRISEDTDDDRRIIIPKFHTSGGVSKGRKTKCGGGIEDEREADEGASEVWTWMAWAVFLCLF